MTAYGNIDSAIAGLKDSLGGFVESYVAVEDIDFGLPVFGYVGDSVNAYNYYADVDKIVFSGDFITDNIITITVNGTAAAAVTFDTDHDTTAALVVAAVAALTGVECVLDPADVNNRTFLIRTRGATCVSSQVITGGTSQTPGTITSHDGQVFLGLSLFDQVEAGKYEDGDSVNVLAREGRAWCTCSTAMESNQPGLLSATGDFANAGTEINCITKSDLAAAGLAIIEVVGQKMLTYAQSF